MASEAITDRPIKLRNLRYPGEVLSLALTFIFLISLYALATIFFPETWAATLKALAITVSGLSVYIVSVKLQQRAALGTMVRVGPRQFPELYDLAAKCAARLSHPFVSVYVKRSSEMSIYTVGLWQKPIIVVTSSLVDQMGPGNLQFFIGREIGHVAGGHIWLRTLLKPLGADVPVIGKLLNSVVFGDWINRTEFTADRAGFVACRSLTVAVSSMLKFGVGVRLFEQLDIKEFLGQIDDVRNVRGHLTEIVAEQPYLTRRIRAIVRFSLSEEFNSLSPGKHSNTQILKAIPRAFVTSKIGMPDYDVDAIAGAQSQSAAKPEERPDDEVTVDAVFDQAITIADYIDVDDDNSFDPALELVAAGGNASFMLRRQFTRIGRNSDNDIVLDNDRTSRYHAEIMREGGAMVIVDQKSRNGVWVNGRRIKEPAEIKSGDLIRIGRQEFTFVVKE
jgi:Zn-dependent protease with chaperone function